MSEWERLTDETEESYVRFLVYRNLGPMRSLDIAYKQFCNAHNRSKSPQYASGQWKDDCAKYSWVSRARAWDIYNLTESGKETFVKFLATLNALVTKAYQTIQNSKELNPDTVIRALDVIAKCFPPETVQALLMVARDTGNKDISEVK